MRRLSIGIVDLVSGGPSRSLYARLNPAGLSKATASGGAIVCEKAAAKFAGSARSLEVREVSSLADRLAVHRNSRQPGVPLHLQLLRGCRNSLSNPGVRRHEG